MSSLPFTLKVFMSLLHAELMAFRQVMVGKIIDTVIWIFVSGVVFRYIMPAFGVPPNFIVVLVTGLLGSSGIVELWTNIVGFMADITGDRPISYELTLPIPPALIFIKKAVFFALTSAYISMIALPCCKILLWDTLPLTPLVFIKFALIFFLTNLFAGMAAVYVASFIPNMSALTHLWMRIIFPLWFFGGFQSTWHSLRAMCPPLAYLNLCNPFVYMLEGTRAALLIDDTIPTLPFWASCSVLLGLIVLFAVFAVRRLKHRLDCV